MEGIEAARKSRGDEEETKKGEEGGRGPGVSFHIYTSFLKNRCKL